MSFDDKVKTFVQRRAPVLKPPLVAVRNAAQILMRRRWKGYCPICEQPTYFVALGPYYRDQLVCRKCRSIPRERALIRVVNELYPDWRSLRIHESSPSASGASLKLAKECQNYVASQYVPNQDGGSDWNGFVVQDLTCQTFPAEFFDLVITQDVFEHLMDPDAAIVDIVRTLKPGGAHIMTVPIVGRNCASRRRAKLVDGEITHLAEPQYHDNPSGNGSLVTVDWGYDIADYLCLKSGCPTSMHVIDDLSQGIRAEYIEVVVTRKGTAPSL
jgi:SAM-dependent methyltransferase